MGQRRIYVVPGLGKGCREKEKFETDAVE